MGKSDSTVAAKDKSDDKGKKRTRNGKIKAESPEPDEEEEEPPLKKQKDEQKAKSKSMQVPVDEGCGVPGDIHQIYTRPSQLTVRRLPPGLYRSRWHHI